MPYDPVHPENSGVLYDESGKPYVMQADGKGGYKRNYLSPAAMGGQTPPDTTGIFRSRPEWNQYEGQYETPIDWGNILSLGTAGALGLGAADAFGGLFGGGAAASEAAPSAAPAAAAGASGTLPATQIGTGMIGPIAGGAGTDVAGLLSAGGSLGANALNGLTSGKGFSSSDLLKLLGVGGAIGLNAAQQGGQGYPPELEEILKLQKNRMQAQSPLYDSILKLTRSRLPTSARG